CQGTRNVDLSSHLTCPHVRAYFIAVMRAKGVRAIQDYVKTIAPHIYMEPLHQFLQLFDVMKLGLRLLVK
ncbi:unnamed protein product, partial [Dovyalis caffra]